MTTQSDALITRLHDGGPIEAAMGKRWHPGRLPESPSQFPFGTYQRIAAPSEHAHDGALDLKERRYQLTIYDTDYSRGDEARAVLVAALDGTKSDWGGVDVSCRLADDTEDIDPEPGGLYRQRVDLYLTSTAA